MSVTPLALLVLRQFPANGQPRPAEPQALPRATRYAWLALESACAAPAVREKLHCFLSPNKGEILRQQLDVLLDLLARSGLETDEEPVRQRLAEELRSARQEHLLAGGFQEEMGTLENAVERVASALEEAGYPTLAQLVDLRSPWDEPLFLGILHFFLVRALGEPADSLHDDSWRCLEMLAGVLDEHGEEVETLLDRPEQLPDPSPQDESAQASEELRQLGLRCFRRGDYRRAVDHFTAAARLTPADAQLYWQRGDAFRLLCQYERALADLTQALRFNPQEPDIFLSRAIVYHHCGEHPRAIADCGAALALDPTCVGAYRTRAAAHAATAAVGEALADLTRIIEIQADDEALYLRGLVHAGRRDFASALADFNQALALNRYHVPALLQRGHAHRRQGQYAEAIRDYSEVLRHHPSNAPAYSGRGLTHKLNGDSDRALADFTEALRLESGSAQDYFHRGILFRARGELARAQADLDAAIRLQPESWPILYVRGKVLLAQGQYALALLDFTEVVRLHPSFLPAYLSRALAHDRLGQHHEAVQDGASAIALDASSPAAWLVRGVVWAHQGNLAAAIDDLTEAIKLDQLFALAYHERSMAYTLQGDHDRALADCHSLINLEPANARGYVTRSLVYHYKGEVERALNDYARALQIDPKRIMAGWNEGLAESARSEATQRLGDYIDGLRPEEVAAPPPSEFRIVIEPEKPGGARRVPGPRKPTARKPAPRPTPPVPPTVPTETTIEPRVEETVRDVPREVQLDKAHPGKPAAEAPPVPLAEEPLPRTAEPSTNSRPVPDTSDKLETEPVKQRKPAGPPSQAREAPATTARSEARESMTCPNCHRDTIPAPVAADRVRCGHCQSVFPPGARPRLRPKRLEEKVRGAQPRKKALTAVAALVGLIVVFGFGRGWFGKSDKVPVHPAQGKATFDGKPMTNATVFLHPVGVKSPPYPRPRAVVREDGTFVLGTYGKEDGAPVGEYKITVEWFKKVPGRDLPLNVLAARYAGPETSGLAVRIEEGDNRLPPIQLTRRGR